MYFGECMDVAESGTYWEVSILPNGLVKDEGILGDGGHAGPD